MNPEEILKLGAKEFWTIHLYLAHKAHTQAEYSRIIMKPK